MKNGNFGVELSFVRKENIIASALAIGLAAGGCSEAHDADLVNCSFDARSHRQEIYLQKSALGTLFELQVGEHRYIWDPQKYDPYHLYQSEPYEKVIDPTVDEKFTDLSSGRKVDINFSSKNWESYSLAQVESSCR